MHTHNSLITSTINDLYQSIEAVVLQTNKSSINKSMIESAITQQQRRVY